MRTSITAVLAVVAVATPAITDAQSKYYMRQRLNGTAPTSAAATPTLNCTAPDHDQWVRATPPGATRSDYPYLGSGYYDKVGSALDRSAQLTTICKTALASGNRTQCFLSGQGGLSVDVLVPKFNGTIPTSYDERDNAIVYEVITCTK